MTKKLTVSLILLLMLSIFFMPTIQSTSHEANLGTFSIPEPLEDQLIELNGEWEFYWNNLYTPFDFKDDQVYQQPEIVNVPQTWTDYEINDEKLSLNGFATYRLQLIFPEEELGTLKALYIPSASSAYSLWINGILLSKNGVVNSNKTKMEPESTPKVVQFLVNSNPTELVVQVSNYHQRKAGIFDAILIGEPEIITEYRERKLLFRSIIVISLLVMGLYHFSLFAFRRKEYSLIFFGLVCIFVAIRATLLEEGLATYLLSFLNWETARKLEYLGASFGVMFFALFTYTQFKNIMSKRLNNLLIGVLLIFSLFIVVTKAVVYTQALILLEILIVVTFSYLIIVYIKSFIKRHEGAIPNLIAASLFFLAILNDVLYYSNVIKTTELTSVGLLIFLFIQSIILSKRYSMAFVQTEKLSKKLSILNASLENQVNQRTKELQHMNSELHVVNEKLKEADKSRSKWIRNISHEIGTPLTNIRAYTRGMLDKVIPSDEEYIQLVYDQSLYLSQMLNDLHDMSDIENRQIKFDKKEVKIREFIYKLYYKYKLDIEKQGITFQFIDLPEAERDVYVALIDEVRIEQVIVNLLTNAQRFVPDKGAITIKLDKYNDRSIKISIIDNGIGIREDEVNRVFERFYKSRNQGKKHNGSGLGLAISKEIIEYHEGTITVESKEGQGSTFSLIIPIQ